MRKRGICVTELDDAEKARFRAAVQPMYDRFRRPRQTHPADPGELKNKIYEITRLYVIYQFRDEFFANIFRQARQYPLGELVEYAQIRFHFFAKQDILSILLMAKIFCVRMRPPSNQAMQNA